MEILGCSACKGLVSDFYLLEMNDLVLFEYLESVVLIFVEMPDESDSSEGAGSQGCKQLE